MRWMRVLAGTTLLCIACGGAPSGVSLQTIAVEASPPVEQQDGALQLRVFSGNMWGIKFASSYIDERFAALAERLEAGNYDIVGLQEMWANAERGRFLEAARPAYPYQVDFHGEAGGGLVVLSKHPIVDARFHQYTARGKWWRFLHGDYWGRKGIAGVRLSTAQGDVWFFVTHLHASYGNRDPDYAVFQMTQTREAKAVVTLVAGSVPAVVVGDFNRTIGTEHYRVLTEQFEGELAWERVPEPDAPERRIDFIYTRNGADRSWHVAEPVEVVMTEPVSVPDDEPQPITDHPVLHATVELRPRVENRDGDVSGG